MNNWIAGFLQKICKLLFNKVWESFCALTCDDKTVIMIQGFSEEAGNNKLRIDQEADFLLN